MKFDSQVVHGTGKCDPATGSICVPIYQTTTYKHPSLTESCGYDYSRIQNPTRQALEETIAMLEEGTHGFAYTTGLAADMAVFSLLSCLLYTSLRRHDRQKLPEPQEGQCPSRLAPFHCRRAPRE